MTYVTGIFPNALACMCTNYICVWLPGGATKDEITEQLCVVALGYNLGLRLRRQEISSLKLPWAIQQSLD